MGERAQLHELVVDLQAASDDVRGLDPKGAAHPRGGVPRPRRLERGAHEGFGDFRVRVGARVGQRIQCVALGKPRQQGRKDVGPADEIEALRAAVVEAIPCSASRAPTSCQTCI
jgi:hypothetical protein